MDGRLWQPSDEAPDSGARESLDASLDQSRRERPDEPGQSDEPDGTGENAGRPGERNEKVLHTRIPGSLDREIKKRARNLGMSVSTVVRHVLLHTFDLVEDIVTDGTNVALSLAGAEPARKPRGSPSPAHALAEDRDDGHVDDQVLAWQEAVLNVNAVCQRCNAILEKGSAAVFGIREGRPQRTIVCRACLTHLVRSSEDRR